MGRRVQQLTRDHLVEFSARHPNRVGGRRSYYWFFAALDAARPDRLQADDRAAVLSLTTPGISRALGPVYNAKKTRRSIPGDAGVPGGVWVPGRAAPLAGADDPARFGGGFD